MKRIIKFVDWFEHFTDKAWYEWALALFAALDCFLFVFPTDGVVISSAYLSPRKWLRFAVLTAIGSALGSLVLAALAQTWGMTWISSQFPSLVSSSLWVSTSELFHSYGLWVLLVVAALPVVHHPALFLGALSGHSLGAIFTFMLLGRLLKYGFFTGLVRFAPQKLKKITNRVKS